MNFEQKLSSKEYYEKLNLVEEEVFDKIQILSSLKAEIKNCEQCKILEILRKFSAFEC